jgi:hypothetical protein
MGESAVASPSEASNEISPTSRKLANESNISSLTHKVAGSLVNNIVAFVTLESFDGQYADRKHSIRTRC